MIYLYCSLVFSTKARKIQEMFSQQLLRYQEDERQRIYRDLHDSIGQSLVLIKNKVQLENEQSTSNMISDTLGEVRNISKQLHPALLEKLGLTASIKKIAKEADKNSDIFFDIQLSNIDDFFSKENELHIYRIIQEAINNLVKHAKIPSATIITEELPNTIKILIMARVLTLPNTPINFKVLAC
jgi:signal transduction histidine kinase